MPDYTVEKRAVFITKWSPRRPIIRMYVDATVNEVTGKIVSIQFINPFGSNDKKQKLGPSAFFVSRTEAIDHVVKIKQQRIKHMEQELNQLRNERLKIIHL